MANSDHTTTTPSRRSIVSALALVAPAVAIAPAAFAAGPDPMYAAIDAYRAAYAFHGECCKRAAQIEEPIYAECRKFEAKLERERDQVTAEIKTLFQPQKPDMTDDEAVTLVRCLGIREIKAEGGFDEVDRLYEQGSDAESAARDAMLRTVPTTTAGMLALLSLILGEIDGPKATTMADIFGDDEAQLLLTSLASFAREQTGM